MNNNINNIFNNSIKKSIKYYQSAILRLKMDYGCQKYSRASSERLKQDNIHRTSPVEALHVEARDSPLKLRKNGLLLRFLYKLRTTPHIHSLLSP